MSDDFNWEVERPSGNFPTEQARSEQRQIEPPEPKPNTVKIPLWGKGHITFEPTSSVSIFALISLLLLLTFSVLISLIGIWVGEAEWLVVILTAIGHGITGIIGAMVGASISKSKDSD